MIDVWLSFAMSFGVAALTLIGPGLLVLARTRMSLFARLAVAGLIGTAVFGVAGILGGIVGLAWQPWQGWLVAALIAAAAWLVGPRLAARQRTVSPDRAFSVSVSVAAAAAVIGVVAFWGFADPTLVSQTYDNVFHLSAIAAILDGGSASSLTLRTLIETSATWAFYPAAWHALVASTVQLTGAPVAVAVNASWVAVAAIVWVPGASWLAQVLLTRLDRPLVGLVAAPLAAGFGAMPYSLLSWGSLYPTYLATALLPAAVAVPIVAMRAVARAGAAGRWRMVLLGVAGVAVAVAAVGLSQPRVLASWALLLTPLLVSRTIRIVRTAWHAGGTPRRYAVWTVLGGGAAMLLTALAGFVVLVTRLGLFDRPLDERLGGPQAAATQSVAAGVLQVLTLALPTGVGTVAFSAPFLALAVLLGIVAAARTAGLRWVVVTYAVVAVLFALAAGSDDVVSKLLTAVWYKDRYRLSSLLPVFGVTFATLGVIKTANLLRRWVARGRRMAIAMSWVTLSTACVSLVAGGASAAIADVFRLPDRNAGSAVVSRSQIEFFSTLPNYVPAGERILGDPWDGSAWTGLFGDRQPVFPHVNGQWDPDRTLLAWELARIEVDPRICAALDRLRVRYVVYDPHEFGGGDPSGNHFPGPHLAVEYGLLSLIASEGRTQLYRIEQCGPLPAP